MIVAFGLEGGSVAVRVPDAPLARDVAGLFPDYARPAGSGSPPPPDLEVLRTGEGLRVRGDPALLGGREEVAPGSRVALLTWIEEGLARGLLALRSDLVHLHAAGASFPGGAVLALGPPGAGKSSLALAWSLAGHPLLGDDVVFLDGGGGARAFRRLLRIDPGRLTEHGVDPRETPHWSEDYDRAWFDPGGAGGWCRDRVRPTLLAFLDRRPDGPPRVDEMEPPEALALALSGVHSTGAPPAACVDPLGRLVSRARAVRVSYGSSAGAARLFVDVAREGTRGRGEPSRGPASGAPAETSSGGSGPREEPPARTEGR